MPMSIGFSCRHFGPEQGSIVGPWYAARGATGRGADFDWIPGPPAAMGA